MSKIKIWESADDVIYYHDDMWKSYVMIEEDFDERIMLYGNRWTKDFIPDWYENVKALLEEMENDLVSYQENDLDLNWYIDNYGKYFDNLNVELLKQLFKLIDEEYYDDEETIFKAAKMLYNDKFVTGTIRGYNQGDWKEYAIKMNSEMYQNKDIIIENLEAFYFGKITEVEIIENDNEENSYFDYIPDDQIWYNNGNLKQFFKDRYSLDSLPVILQQKRKQVIVSDWEEI